MMWAAVQAETDHSNLPFYQGEVKALQSQTILQDAARATALAPNTIMAQIASSRKWVPLTDVDPTLTKGRMVCGAFGSTVKAMKSITDGSFKVQVDGETALDITGLNFSKIAGIGDTSATCTTGALGCNLATLQGITTGDFAITVDGTALTITGLDFSAIHSLDGAAEVIDFAAAGRFRCQYDPKTTKFIFISPTKGATSTITALSDTGGAGADISEAGHLNGRTGTAVLVQGTGTDSQGNTVADVINANATVMASGLHAMFNGTAFEFVSPTIGVGSAVSVLTAGSAGTDISGAGYLNGLTGTGTATAGTGGDGSNIPAGIYRGAPILAATLVAGDVTGNEIVVGGPAMFDGTNVVLENSLTLNTVITSMSMTIARALELRGLYATDTAAADANV